MCSSSNLDSGKTRSAAYRCSQTRPPTAELPHGYVGWALTTLFLRSSGHFNTDPACRTGVLVRRLHRNIYKPEVIASRLISHRGSDFQIYLRLLKKRSATVDCERDRFSLL